MSIMGKAYAVEKLPYSWTALTYWYVCTLQNIKSQLPLGSIAYVKALAS